MLAARFKKINRFYFLNRFKFVEKLSGKFIEFPLPPAQVIFVVNFLHWHGTFVIVGETVMTHYY